MHEEGVPDPEASPAQWALRDGNVLAVHSNGLRGRLTHRAAADVLRDLGLADRHHGDGGGGGEPVGFIIAPGVVAHFVDVAVDEGHGAEAGQAGASKPQVLVVGFLLPLHEQQAVTHPQLAHPGGAHGNLF